MSHSTNYLPKAAQIKVLLTELSKHPAGVSIKRLCQAQDWNAALTINTSAPLSKMGLTRLMQPLDSLP